MRPHLRDGSAGLTCYDYWKTFGQVSRERRRLGFLGRWTLWGRDGAEAGCFDRRCPRETSSEGGVGTDPIPFSILDNVVRSWVHLGQRVKWSRSRRAALALSRPSYKAESSSVEGQVTRHLLCEFSLIVHIQDGT